MAKWSEKMAAENCPYCNCKEGEMHDKLCRTQIAIDWGKVGRTVTMNDTCPDCGVGTCGHAAPDDPLGDNTHHEATKPNCTKGYCNCNDDPRWPPNPSNYGVVFRKNGERDEGDEEGCWINVFVKYGYHSLFGEFVDALEQAQNGKGSERHGNGLSFMEQPALTITRAVGIGFPLGQAMKKIQESQRMDTDAAKRELLGAINYLAAAILSFDD